MSKRFLPLLLLLAACGCTMPKSAVGLDKLLIDEGHNYGTRYEYRCTRGAHRGASEEYKENSRDALLVADNDPKFAFIEFDVQYSKDDKIVVFHDRRMLRTFGSPRKISDTTFEELLTITGGQIAEFHDVMRHLKKKLNVEIKSQGDLERDKKLVDEVISVVKHYKRENDVLISSISGDVIKYVNEQYPKTPTGQIFWINSSTYFHIEALTKGLYETINETGADYLMLHVANLRNIDNLLRLKPRGKTIVFWAFDDRIYVVHADLSDRMWGQSATRNFLQLIRYDIARFYRWLIP